MKIIETELPGVLIIEPDVFQDMRGFFMETWNYKKYHEAGIKVNFLQDNFSYSRYGVLRGLHFQNPKAQGKLVYVIQGEVFDVAVDVRAGSPSFGKWIAVHLSSENKRQVFIPGTYAHGFCVTSEAAIFAYKCTNLYSPSAERGIFWKDPEIGIKWPLATPLLSERDKQLPLLKNCGIEYLPSYK